MPQGRVEVELSRWRGEESPLPGGGLLINDAYNANPASMRAALEHLAEHEGRTVAVLGEMAELGPTSPEYHQEIGELVSDLGIDVVLGVGELARAYGGDWVADAANAAERAPELVQPGDVVLDQGLARCRARSRRGSSHRSLRLVERVLAAGILAMAISILAGPKFIDFLRRNEFGQHIREELPAEHHLKQGTPTMGGLLILFSMAIPFLALSKYTQAGLTVFFVTLACGAIGFVDDWFKVRHRRSLGLNGRWKLLLLAAITVGVGWSAHDIGLSTDVYAPILDWRITLTAFGFYLLLFIVIAGAANGANLTDGIDGLAVGVAMIALITFVAMNVVTWIRSARDIDLRDASALDLAILGAALTGGAIGFLWYNAFPAEVIMGDTGSMALGGAIGAFAVMTKTELLLLLIGGIFVVEAVSVILQVVSFRYWGRRIFLMAPIHHHFAMKAWSETKIMVRFWILAAIMCAAAFALYYRYYLDFRGLR